MGNKITVGPVDGGLRTDRTAFNIDNDSFPTLINAYQWRGRVKRKRGTVFLGRLTRYFNSLSTSYFPSPGLSTAFVGGVGNLLTGFGLQANGNIVPGSVTINGTGGPYTDPTMDGYLTPTGTGGVNTINYSTGVVTIPAVGTGTVSASFDYYPDLPVLGLEDLTLGSNNYPGTIAFDTTYSYNITTTFPAALYDISFYKNPTTFGSYVSKTNGFPTPLKWNGNDYQQFWTTNYQGALWATNGVPTPFSITNIGMQFAPSSTSTITYTSNTSTTLTITITNCPLIIGDFVFVNEWIGSTAANSATLNFQSGYVTAASPNTTPNATKTITITFPNAAIATDTYTPGIIQYLTNNSDTTKDCLRWYDGDPTNMNAVTPSLTGRKGWVNFCPPLSQFLYSINDTPASQYYLVGAKMIFSYKDRLIFFAPVIQTSQMNSQIYLKDTIIFSQNGTPFYTASFTGNPVNSKTVFNPILVPNNQTATASAYFEDQTGFGGFKSVGVDQEITTIGPNEDAIIVGFPRLQTRMIYTGNDSDPFNFYVINSEYGSGSTFASIVTDKGILSKGSRGYVITSQVDAARFDLEVPDQVFEVNLKNNGAQRICAQRNYIDEWAFFTYPSDSRSYKFPNQTFQFNYRDNSWGIFNECYTTYGLFRIASGLTWATLPYSSWSEWTEPWDSGISEIYEPDNIAGNQQGFIVYKDMDLDESPTLYIQNLSSGTVTSPDHTLNTGDFIIINGCIGTTSALNGLIFQVGMIIDDNNFLINNPTAGTYFGGGTITRLYVPIIQTKQFPVYWGDARKTRLGPQQYLFTTTANSQITLLIFLSQNANDPYNFPMNTNDSLIYSSILYTCPESTNLGLTPSNVNLNLVTAGQQAQTWHRMNTSLIGDTVQIGFTLDYTQMTAQDPVTLAPINATAEIELHGFILDVSPSQLLC